MDLRNFEPPRPGAWEIETAHFSRPVTRYSAVVYPPVLASGFKAGMARYGLLLDYLDLVEVERFIYACFRVVGAPASAGPPPPRFIFQLAVRLHPAMRRRLATARSVFPNKIWREDVAQWNDVYRPEILARNDALRAVDPTKLSSGDLMEHLRLCREAFERSIFVGHSLNPCTFIAIGDLLLHAAEWTGQPLHELAHLMSGSSEVSVGAKAELAALVAALLRSPSAITALASDEPGDLVLETVRATSPEIARAYDAYVDRVGLRLLGYDVSSPYILEMPDVICRLVRAAVDGKGVDPSRRFDAAVAAVRDKVPDAHRAEFDELVVEARSTYHVRDERSVVSTAYSGGLVRRALLAAGERLTAEGKLANREHAVDLAPDEVAALLAGGAGPSGAHVAERVSYRMSRTTADAPQYVGTPVSKPPPADWLPPDAARVMRSIVTCISAAFDVLGGIKSADPTMVKGFPVSPGEHIGTARVILDPVEISHVRTGDVLVASATAPAYNVLLPLVGAIVTDKGGFLSHAAIIAREYGIPAVVGCGDATRKIRDAARVRVNGTTGEVSVVS